jgi:hypothetical protein
MGRLPRTKDSAQAAEMAGEHHFSKDALFREADSVGRRRRARAGHELFEPGDGIEQVGVVSELGRDCSLERLRWAART